MSFIKLPLPESVLQASQQRIEWVMENFSRICVSFSGGKDSTTMLHLTAQHARHTGKKICVLFVDWEAQFSCTIAHCERMREEYRDVIEQFFWVALPLTTQLADPIQPRMAVLGTRCELGAPTAERCDYRSRLFPVLSIGYEL